MRQQSGEDPDDVVEKQDQTLHELVGEALLADQPVRAPKSPESMGSQGSGVPAPISPIGQPAVSLDSFLSDAISLVGSDPDVLISANETSGEASPSTCALILEELRIKPGGGKRPAGETFVCTACLFQGGCTSPKQHDRNAHFAGTTSITVGEIRRACRKYKVTVRQFARGMKQQIIDFFISPQGMLHVRPGNLAKAMQLEFNDLSPEELIWCSDFQTYNPECPDRVRKWLVKNYRSRFRNKNNS